MPPRPKPPGPKDLCVYFAEVDEKGAIPEETIQLVRRCLIDKIFSENEDHIAFFRSDEGSNAEYVKADWNALRRMEKQFRQVKTPSEEDETANSLQMLQEIGESISVQATEDSYETLKMLCFIQLKGDVKEKGIKRLATTLKQTNIFASFILPDDENTDELQKKNILLFNDIIEDTDFEDILFVTTYTKAKHQIVNTLSNKSKKSMPWNVELEIGPDITINVSGFVCTRTNKLSIMTKALTKDMGVSVDAPASHQSQALQRTDEDEDNGGGSRGPESKTVAFQVAKDVTEKETVWKDKTGEVVEEADLGKGYFYGDKIIPYNEFENETTYSSGPKCLKLLVFCPRSNILPAYQKGDGTTLFYANSKGEKESELKFAALLTAMHESERIAIVRKVYRKDAKVVLGVLAPDMKRQCLVFCELCFADDVSVPHFPTLVKRQEKRDAENLTPKETVMDEFIQSMTLDEFDALTEGPVDPAVSLLRENITRRVLGSVDSTLQSTIEDNIGIFFETKFSASEKFAGKLKDSFPLQINKVEDERASGFNIFRKREPMGNEDPSEQKRSKIDVPETNEVPVPEVEKVETMDVDYGELMDEL